MPVCVRCGVMKASAEMRKSPKSGHLCRDKSACLRRQKTPGLTRLGEELRR